jgi:L-amino acid N-acyltransferase
VSGGSRRPPTRLRVTIRPALPGDVDAMRAIYNDAVRSTTATFDTEPRTLADQLAWFDQHDARHPILVAEIGGEVVGWVSLSPWSERPAYEGTAEISEYVAAPWRRRGIGHTLISEIFLAAARCNLHVVLARIAEGNPASRALHLAAGFKPVGVMHEVGYKFDQFLDVELMERRLGEKSTLPSRGSASRRRMRSSAKTAKYRS